MPKEIVGMGIVGRSTPSTKYVVKSTDAEDEEIDAMRAERGERRSQIIALIFIIIAFSASGIYLYLRLSS